MVIYPRTPKGVPDITNVWEAAPVSHTNKIEQTTKTVPAHRYKMEVRHRRPERETGVPLDEEIRTREFCAPYMEQVTQV